MSITVVQNVKFVKMIEDILRINRDEIINTIKVLCYKENPFLFEKIGFENENAFLEPLLFAYFNSKKDNLFTNDILQEIMQGYCFNKEKIKIEQSSNSKNISFIPEFGYFRKGDVEPYDKILKYDKIEILKEIHPILKKYFIEAYGEETIIIKPKFNSVWKENHKILLKAIAIIKNELPIFYQQFIFSNKRVYIHDNPKILNFTTVETLGMLYFYVTGKYNLIYFVEELIHQGSHNFLYFVIHNRKKYFKIDVDNIIMRDLTRKEWDYRSVYGAFHGLFTVTQRVENFDILLSKNVFSGKEKHELFGRLTDQFSRFRTGLELLDFDEVYTELGLAYYTELDHKCFTILEKYRKLKDYFDLSNRDLDFRYNDFCKLNPINDFYKREAEGFFNF